jgi:hypothetical protein
LYAAKTMLQSPKIPYKLEDLEKIDPTDILTLTRLHGGRL